MIDWMEKRPADMALDGLKSLISTPWFTRLWVYQEMAISPVLLCHIGDEVIEWDSIKLATLMFSRAAGRYHAHLSTDRGEPSLNFIKFQERLAAMSEPRTSLLTLAKASRTLDVRVEHDRIYALLSMTSWVRVGAPLPQELRPNYGIPECECMCLATKAMIEETGTLDVFSTL